MEQQSLFSSLSVTHPTYASTPLKGRGILSYVHLSSLCNHKSGFFLTAGNPLYEAQNSDFILKSAELQICAKFGAIGAIA